MVLFPPLDVVQEPGDDRRFREGPGLGCVHAPFAALDQDDGPCVPRNGLAVAQAVGAFEERRIQAGAAPPHQPVVREQVLGAPELVAKGMVEARARELRRQLEREFLQPLIMRAVHYS